MEMDGEHDPEEPTYIKRVFPHMTETINVKDYGIEVNSLDWRNETILQAALRSCAPYEKRCEVVKVIMEHVNKIGLDLNNRDGRGETARSFIKKYYKGHEIDVLFENANKRKYPF